MLERIVDTTNHVQTFYQLDSKDTSEPQPRRVGWKEASTFPGFCAKHDTATFAPLETKPFAGTEEQCFLVGYRALCHEIYQKHGSLRASPVMRELGDRGFPLEAQERFQDVLNAIEAGTRKGLACFEALKSLMDQQLLAGQYAGWSRLIVRFRGKLCVVSTGAGSPNRDFDGVELQNLHSPDPTGQETFMFGVVATSEGGAIVFTWLKAHVASRKFLESFLRQGPQYLGSLLVQFMFAYVENTFFSPSWWKSLTSDDRRHLTRLARISNAYYTDFSYVSRRIVPWQIAGIEIENKS